MTSKRNRLRSTGSEISEVDNPEQEQDLILSYDPDAIVVGMLFVYILKYSCLFTS